MSTEMKVSAHDRVSGVILALLALVGFFVALLVIAWINPQMADVGPEDDKIRGVNPQIVETSATERVLDLAEHDSRPDDSTIPFTMTLASVKRAVHLDQSKLDVTSQTGDGNGDNEGGDSVEWQPPVCQLPIDPVRRVHFNVESIDNYARQLDYFEIELGVLQPLGNSILYARRFTKSSPARRDGHPRDEKRNFFAWRHDDPLAALDRKLLATAGVDVGDGGMLQLWPNSVWRQLLAAEAQYARQTGLLVEMIHNTDFGVKMVPGGFEFYVIHQQPKLEHIGAAL